MLLPEHMDLWSRNARLYETLNGMGLYIDPIPESDDPTKFNRLVVSAGLPFQAGSARNCTEKPSQAGVAPAMKRSQVDDVVAAPESGGENVVVFPTVL
jgi:hypothetical protein